MPRHKYKLDKKRYESTERNVKENNMSYEEIAKEVFTLNIGCPHCNKTISLSLAKLELKNKK